MSKVITVRVNFEVNTDAAEKKLEQTALKATMVRQILARTTGMMRRMGLPENVEKAMTFMTRMINIAYQLQAMLVALNLALAGTPGGWLLAGLMGLAIVMDVGDLMMAT